MLWRFELDLDHNNMWGYDFTRFVKSAEWSLGATQPFATMPNDAKATIKVNNEQGYFNPEDAGLTNPFMLGSVNMLKPNRRCRIVINRYDSRASDGVVQFFKLDESSGTAANDSSPQGFDGVYSAGVDLAATTSPIPGHSMPYFDGTDAVNLYSGGLVGAFDPALGSVSLFLQTDDEGLWSDPNLMYLLNLYVDSNNHITIYKNPSPFPNQLVFEYAAGGTIEQITYTVTPTTDAIHLAMTWDKANDRVRVYVDGVLQNTATTLGTWAGNIGSTTSCLGAFNTSGTNGFVGNLAYYQLRDREITATEAAELAANGDAVMWIGWIRRIVPPYTPAGAQVGKTEATITCEGMKSRLERVTIPLSIYENATGDEVVLDALRNAVIPPALPGGWLAGQVGYSEAGQTTYASENASYTDLDVGVTTFPLLGDKEQTGWQAIKLVTDGERGFFYQNRAGLAVWNNRHARFYNTTSQATITDTSNKARKIKYEWDVDVINNICRVTVNPRKIASSTTVYELQQPIIVPPGATVTFEAALRDADGIPGGATSLSNTPTFTGATPTVSVSNLGDRAQVTLDNTANTQAATLAAFTITGTPIQDRNPIIGTAMDADSVGEFGKRELTLNIPALATLQQAKDIAEFEVLRRKDARASIDEILFIHAGDDSDNTLQLDLAIDDRITLTLASKSHDADHFIIGEKHEWNVAGDGPIHETTYYLEPAGTYQFWLAGTTGYSEAGVTTYGGY